LLGPDNSPIDETIETTVADSADNPEIALQKKSRGELVRFSLDSRARARITARGGFRQCRPSEQALAHGGASAPEPRGSSGLIARPRAHARARTAHAPAPPDRWVEELTGEARCLDARASNVERVPTIPPHL
jgi:hypothetical protein